MTILSVLNASGANLGSISISNRGVFPSSYFLVIISGRFWTGKSISFRTFKPSGNISIYGRHYAYEIGEFSSLTQVSVKTLRWYDEMGLLKPSRVDASSGYRKNGFCRTLFLTCAETEEDPGKFVTEIQVPVASRMEGFKCGAAGSKFV